MAKLKEELRAALRHTAAAEADAQKARSLATNAEVMMSEMTRLYEDNDLLVGRIKQMEVDLQVKPIAVSASFLCSVDLFYAPGRYVAMPEQGTAPDVSCNPA